MDLYLAGLFIEKEDTICKCMPSNVLASYFLEGDRIDKRHELLPSNSKLFVDSGAFTMWTQNVAIDVDKYIDWINQRPYINLFGQIDVIPKNYLFVKEAAQKTWLNYLYMRSKVNNPNKLLYTFHVGEPFDFLKQALDWTDENNNPIQYMALGGMVGKSYVVRERFLDKCFEIIYLSKNRSVKIHTFGMTDVKLLSQFPITSADSTAYVMPAIRGSIRTEFGDISVSPNQKYSSDYYLNLTKEDIEIIESLVKKFGFDISELVDSRDNRVIYNARYMNYTIGNILYKKASQRKSLF